MLGREEEAGDGDEAVGGGRGDTGGGDERGEGDGGGQDGAGDDGGDAPDDEDGVAGLAGDDARDPRREGEDAVAGDGKDEARGGEDGNGGVLGMSVDVRGRGEGLTYKPQGEDADDIHDNVAALAEDGGVDGDKGLRAAVEGEEVLGDGLGQSARHMHRGEGR